MVFNNFEKIEQPSVACDRLLVDTIKHKVILEAIVDHHKKDFITNLSVVKKRGELRP